MRVRCKHVRIRSRFDKAQLVFHGLSGLTLAPIDSTITVLVDWKTEQRPKVRVRLVTEKGRVAQHAESLLRCLESCGSMLNQVPGVLTSGCDVTPCPAHTRCRPLFL